MANVDLAHAPSILRSRDLLWEWTRRNIRSRYQQSVLGWLWAILQPAGQVAIFTVVFTFVVRVDTGDTPYIIFSYVAIVPWTFLAMSLTDMSNSIVENMSLVTKIYFPREILPIAAMLARLLDFAVASSIVVLLMLVYRVDISIPALLSIPVILAVHLMLVIGLGLLLSAANVFVRDVRSILVLGIQLWFYASPTLYPVSMIPAAYRPYYYLNPMAGIIESYRGALLHGQVPGLQLLISAAPSLLVFIAGYWIFKRVEFRFADII